MERKKEFAPFLFVDYRAPFFCSELAFCSKFESQVDGNIYILAAEIILIYINGIHLLSPGCWNLDCQALCRLCCLFSGVIYNLVLSVGYLAVYLGCSYYVLQFSPHEYEDTRTYSCLRTKWACVCIYAYIIHTLRTVSDLVPRDCHCYNYYYI